MLSVTAFAKLDQNIIEIASTLISKPVNIIIYYSSPSICGLEGFCRSITPYTSKTHKQVVIHLNPRAVKSWDNLLWWNSLRVACQVLPDPELILHLLQIKKITLETILMTTRKGITSFDILTHGCKAEANVIGRKNGADIIPTILEEFNAMVHRLPAMRNYEDAASKCAYRNCD
jgi:hypothetical protein